MAAQSSSISRRILCTEDDPDTLEVLRVLLEMEGFDVTCAADPAQALHLAKSETFDLYLLDQWMPQMDGDALCQQLRQFDSTTPILFYSGATSPADKARAMNAGANGYLIKPARPDQLVAEIRRLITPLAN